jgi:hypothetical protein
LIRECQNKLYIPLTLLNIYFIQNIFHQLFKVEHDLAFFASLFHSEHKRACVQASACERARQISRVPKRD